jgi:hypothetical protein
MGRKIAIIIILNLVDKIKRKTSFDSGFPVKAHPLGSHGSQRPRKMIKIVIPYDKPQSIAEMSANEAAKIEERKKKSADLQKKVEGEENNIASQILQSLNKDQTEGIPKDKLKFQPPPNYEHLGRGLVYNCQGKHWACVDKSGYFQCQKNKFYRFQNSQEPDCVEWEVYASEKDCSVAQLIRINRAVKTDFCGKNRTPANK